MVLVTTLLLTIAATKPEQQNRLLAFNAKLTGLAEGIFLTLWFYVDLPLCLSHHQQVWLIRDKVWSFVHTECLAVTTYTDCSSADSTL